MYFGVNCIIKETGKNNSKYLKQIYFQNKNLKNRIFLAFAKIFALTVFYLINFYYVLKDKTFKLFNVN